MLQWGRDQLIAEILRQQSGSLQLVLLQWGRDQLIAEILRQQSGSLQLVLLQWGRDQLIAEMVCFLPVPYDTAYSFNGAAIS